MHARHKRVSRLGQPGLSIAGSGDGKGFLPPGAEHRVREQLWDTGAVIGVDMGQQDEIDAGVLDAEFVESD